ncbi:hypothetical protein, partial [Rhizorhapis sp. SPR117]|uniref:hypothetical protein n=1 Tax=Rhizorhapis sp. SPR117 TaxID=2912611 RepID=UPI001F1FA7EF|nr:hypothetical protein [Rhizorhapis sp. SPR117]
PTHMPKTSTNREYQPLTQHSCLLLKRVQRPSRSCIEPLMIDAVSRLIAALRHPREGGGV